MAPPFLGEYEHSIDDKGRLAVPARFRGVLNDGLYITRGLDRCLVIWDADSYRTQADFVQSHSWLETPARRLQRFYFSGGVEAHLDKLGRILVPQFLREYARLEADVVVVGVGDRFEVWARGEWQRELAELERDSAELAEQLAGHATA